MVCSLGDTADPDRDTIEIDGKPIASNAVKTYIMLHKPRGYVTTLSDEKGRKTVAQLVSDCGVRVYPVGRLDMDSEGLLLLTNDGEFANRLMHPRHVVDKVYLVHVDDFSNDKLSALRKPIELDGYRIREPQVSLLNSKDSGKALLEITIHEGRNRQIRRMCQAAGMRVLRLKRIKESNVFLGDLPLGRWRHLTHEELKSLQE